MQFRFIFVLRERKPDGKCGILFFLRLNLQKYTNKFTQIKANLLLTGLTAHGETADVVSQVSCITPAYFFCASQFSPLLLNRYRIVLVCIAMHRRND